MKCIVIVAVLCFISCQADDDQKIHLPSQVYHYSKIDTTRFAVKQNVYVPIYSHIYAHTGIQMINLTATLSIRNISYADNFYITDVIYYGSQGEVLKEYLDSAILLKPMTSVEFVVQESDSKGGAGANFVVKWGAEVSNTEPLIQAVMTGTTTGISFVTNGVNIDKTIR